MSPAGPACKNIKLVIPSKSHATFSNNLSNHKNQVKAHHLAKKSQRRVHKGHEVPRPFKITFFLELFCGGAKLSAAIARLVPMVVTWDILFGPAYDLSIKANQSIIFGWILAGWIVGLHLGTPCSSFSCVRDRPGGPPRLRSDICPLGLPDLRPGDQQTVRLGNMLMYFSARCLRLCVHMHVPATLENPRLSRLWICSPISAVLRKRVITFNHVDFCMFGTPWKKPTGLLACFLDLGNCARFQCHGCPPGYCSRTGKRHFILTGVDDKGKFWTKRAEPYPNKFCNFIARLYCDYLAKRSATDFGKYVLGN